MADVVIAEFMDDHAVEGLRPHFDVAYDPTLVDDRPRLIGSIAQARALIVRNRTSVDAELLDAAPNLVVVGRLGVGLDNIDLGACAQRGIAVRPATGANADAVAEYVIAAAMLTSRGAFSSTEQVASGAWPRRDLVGHEVAGRTLGLIGFGDIARRVAGRARSLGMHVVAYDPYLDPGHRAWNLADSVTFDALVSRADIISIHVPLSDETHGLIDAGVIEKMRPGASIINTSRGGIVDEDALAAALSEGHLAGAVLDVFAHEPVSAQDGARFAGVPGLILTPHIAGVTVESNERVSAMVADAVAAELGQGGTR